MRLIGKHYKLIALGAACAALGVGVSAITSAGAATPASSTTTVASGAIGSHHLRKGLARRVLGGAVQGDLVVHGKSGFATVMFERGTVDSVSGQQLTLTEATPKATYKQVTLTIPANARVRDNRMKATLSELKAGQRVTVIQAPKRTLVIART